MSSNSFVDAIAALFEDMVISREMLGAGLTVMLYDWFLTLSDEVEYIWRARWSPVKVVFLLNRYFMPLTLVFGLYGWSGSATILSRTSCKAFITTDSFLVLAFFATLHWLVAMRAWALWERTRVIAVVIWGCFILYLSASAVLLGFAMAQLDLAPALGVNVCFGPSLPKFLWTVWLPAMMFETLVFSLTAWKAVQHHMRKIDTPILTILYRDGILYFIFICLNSFINLMMWAVAPLGQVILFKYFSTGICAVAGAHLILDLIEVGHLSGASAASHSHNTNQLPQLKGVGILSKHKGEVFEMMTHHSFIQNPTLTYLEEEAQDQLVSFSSTTHSHNHSLWTPPQEWLGSPTETETFASSTSSSRGLLSRFTSEKEVYVPQYTPTPPRPSRARIQVPPPSRPNVQRNQTLPSYSDSTTQLPAPQRSRSIQWPDRWAPGPGQAI